jgi:hypothetical protein
MDDDLDGDEDAGGEVTSVSIGARGSKKAHHKREREGGNREREEQDGS